MRPEGHRVARLESEKLVSGGRPMICDERGDVPRLGGYCRQTLAAVESPSRLPVVEVCAPPYARPRARDAWLGGICGAEMSDVCLTFVFHRSIVLCLALLRLRARCQFARFLALSLCGLLPRVC